MTEKELRRNLSIFPMGSVMRLTDLTARQIRYYEEQGLVTPERTEGNRRLYSLNDMDRLLDIKDLLASGNSIAAIKEGYAKKQLSHLPKTTDSLSDAEVRRLLHDELQRQSGFSGGGPFSSREF